MKESLGSLLVVVFVVCESGQVKGGEPVLSGVAGLGLMIGTSSVRSMDVSVGESGYSSDGAAI